MAVSTRHVNHQSILYPSIVVLIELIFAFSNIARAADVNPLRPVDTSSPRATLQGFVVTMDEVYRNMKEIVWEYAESQRLYPSLEEQRKQAEVLSTAEKAIKVLDPSGIPPVLRDTVVPERTVQLKEILDRIDLPPFETIPDRDAMTRASSKRWRLPGTEIDIALVEGGPRSGEYLVAPDTVDRLPEFYERVKDLPYKPGPAAELDQIYRRLSSGRAATIYDAYSNSPRGLQRIIPPRWMLRLPAWAKARIAGAASWQWLGVFSGLLISASFIYSVYRLGRHFATRKPEETGPGWHALLTPFAIILVSAVAIPLLCAILRISGTPRETITFLQTAALYLSAAWLSIVVASILAEAVVALEHQRRHSLDSQLVRLGMRFAGIALAVGLLIQGSYELGFPTYSVLAGLGVGGLAVALAAQDSLANLLGSMLIMVEKPFRVGHLVKVAGNEGIVEDVGFRSTRIRTFDNSLISIPNNAVVNATIENLSLRRMRRQRFVIQVTDDTPREKLRDLVAGIKQLITNHPMTNKTNFNVHFTDFGESSLNILIHFFLEVKHHYAELEAREEILLGITDLAKSLTIVIRPGQSAE
jgi:MscS family membrane protein